MSNYLLEFHKILTKKKKKLIKLCENFSPETMQKMIAYKPAQTQVLIKKKRCHECFADAIFSAADRFSLFFFS